MYRRVSLQHSHDVAHLVATEILADAGITGRVEAVNAQGMLMFTDGPVRDYREFLASIDDDFHRLFWFGLVNQGVVPHPYGARQQWTISVQHAEEHVDAAHEAFKEIAPRLAAEQ